LMYASVVKKGIELLARFPWRIGIVTFMVYPKLLKTDEGAGELVATLARDPFFDLLEVAHMRDEEWKKLEEFKGVKQFALGLQPEVLVRGLNPSSPNEEERRKASERMRELIRIAGERGMVAAGLCSGPNVEGPEREKAIEATIKTLRELAEEAAKYGMNVYIETFDWKWDKKRLLGPLSLAAQVVEKVRETHRNVYIMWDLSHGPMLDETPDTLRSYPDLIGHIHIGCTKKVDDKLYDWHPGFYRPGALNDERDVAKLLEVLHDIKYRGAISFEVKPEEGQHPMEVVYTAKAVLLRAFQIFLEGL